LDGDARNGVPFLRLRVFLLGLFLSAAQADDWLYYGGSQGGEHRSALTQINPDNVGGLELAWSYQTGELDAHPQRKAFASIHTTPILLPAAAGGALAFCTPFNRIVALDPASGSERWIFDAEPDLGPIGTRYNCRGIAYRHDPSATACRHQLFMATTDLRLVAVDAETGRPCADFGDGGQVDVRRAVDAEASAKAALLNRPADYRHGDLQFSSPPAVFDDLVIIGSSNNTKFRRDDGPSGKVRAYDARDGSLRWEFDPVPRQKDDPQNANWSRTALDTAGAANVWSMMSVDQQRGLVFLPTASASPDFFGGGRPGDNRYANSVVALHARTGVVAWHFQIVHHDVWDLDTPAQPILSEIRKGNESIPVVIQLTKQGLIFVLHRDTGVPVFPVEERPVPVTAVAGETLSPTQPYPLKPEPLVPHGVAPTDAWGFTFFDRGFCRNWIKRLRHDHYYGAPSQQGTAMFPGMGVNNWGGGAVDKIGNQLIVPINRAMTQRRLIPLDEVEPETLRHPMAGLAGNIGAISGSPYAQQFQPMLSPLFSPCNPPPWGELAAIDLDSGDIRWRRTLGVLDKLMPVPIPLPWGTPNAGGPIVTDSGLVFIGAMMDERFRAFDAQTGEQLWETQTPTSSMATPMTYQVDGRQYVIIASGGHMWQYAFKIADFVLAYALPDRLRD